MTERLRIANALPDELVRLPAAKLGTALAGPTLFDLRKDAPPLFISVLLHGNEISGWNALRQLASPLRETSALLFVGNVAAAAAGRRTLAGHVDFNRVWEGGDAPEAAIAEEVAHYAEAADVQLAIDVHNNTGRNPPYSVVARDDAKTLKVARAFSPRALLATQPNGFQTRRFARFCTAVTVEVGTPDDPKSTQRAATFLHSLLAKTHLADEVPPLALYETTARVIVDDDALIHPDTQRFNFLTAPAGTVLACAGTLTAEAADGSDASAKHLRRTRGATVLRRAATLAMYTGDVEAARQDCLCYLLEPRAVDD